MSEQAWRQQVEIGESLLTELLLNRFFFFLPPNLRSLRQPAAEAASMRMESRKVHEMRKERRGTVEGKHAAPALLDLKPQSCL